MYIWPYSSQWSQKLEAMTDISSSSQKKKKKMRAISVAMIPVSEMVGRGSISRLQTCQHIYFPMCANTAHGQKPSEINSVLLKTKQKQKINT